MRSERRSYTIEYKGRGKGNGQSVVRSLDPCFYSHPISTPQLTSQPLSNRWLSSAACSSSLLLSLSPILPPAPALLRADCLAAPPYRSVLLLPATSIADRLGRETPRRGAQPACGSLSHSTYDNLTLTSSLPPPHSSTSNLPNALYATPPSRSTTNIPLARLL